MTTVQIPNPPTLTISERAHPSCCASMKAARTNGTIILFGIDTMNYLRVLNEAGKYYITSHPLEYDYTYERALLYCPWCAAKL